MGIGGREGVEVEMGLVEGVSGRGDRVVGGGGGREAERVGVGGVEEISFGGEGLRPAFRVHVHVRLRLRIHRLIVRSIGYIYP